MSTSFDPIITLTVLTNKGGLLTKTILPDGVGGIVKEPAAAMTAGTAETVSLPFNEFGAFLRSLKPNQAIAHGVCGHDRADIVSAAKFTGQTGAITRTKKFFRYPDGWGIGMLDHDPAPGRDALTPAQLFEAVSAVWPAFADLPKVITGSTSSYIFGPSGEPLAGRGSGFHAYFPFRPAAALPELAERLFKRLWSARHGYITISVAGSQLIRTIFDAAVFSPERIDFCAGAQCIGCAQRLPAPDYHSGQLQEDAEVMLPQPLTRAEEAAFKALVEVAKEQTRPEAEKIRGTRMKQEVEILRKERGIAPEAAEAIVKARHEGHLEQDDFIQFQDGRVVTVAEILASPEQYHGQPCADPLEPECGTSKAMLFCNATGSVILHSFLHGGQKFMLRQPGGDPGHQEQERQAATAKNVRQFGTDIPEHILRPGGLLEEFSDYVERSRAVSSRLFSLALGLAALGALIGQKVSIFGLLTNFYIILVGRSGIGKDAAQGALLALTDIEQVLNEHFDNCDVTSETAILKLLERRPVCLSVLDEVGFFFTENNGERSPGRRITQLMLKLFSSVDRSEGKRYADTKNDVILPYHHYSLVGSSTPEVLFKAFTPSDAASGFIPRCLFVAEDSEPVRPKLQTSRDGEAELARRLAEIAELELPLQKAGNLDPGRPVPRAMPISEAAQVIFEAFSEKTHFLKVKYHRDAVKGPIYNRCFEHGAKLALVHAVSRCGAGVIDAEITREDAAFGVELAEILTEWTAIQFEANLVDSEFAALCKRVIEVLEADLGAGRPGTTWRTLARAIRRPKLDLEKAVEVLKIRGEVGAYQHEYQPGKFTEAFHLMEGYGA